MKGFTHLAGGALAGLCISKAVCPDQLMETALVVGSCAAGSLLPDIDVGTSKLGNKFPALSYTLQFIFGHRGIFHSLLLWAIPIYNLYVAFPQFRLYTLCCGGGILTHLFLDMLNPSGVPLMWPHNYRFRIAGFHSGGLADWILGLVLMFCCMFVFHCI